MEEKDVVFLCQYFFPEYISSARLPFDIAAYLARQGYKVGALCGYPKEYSYVSDCPVNETAQGVDIHRMRYLQTDRHSFFGRAMNVISFTLSAFFHIHRLKKCKCVVVISDPPVLPIISVFANKLYKTKIIFISYDVFPEIAVAADMINTKGPFYKVMNYINRRLHRNVSKVVALTDEMKSYLLENRTDIPSGMIDVIPNWATEDFDRSRSQSCYDAMGYPSDSFVVAYFGNLGTCQDIETLLAAAKELKNNPKIQFLIAGHGNKIPRVTELIKRDGLSNVKLLEFLEGDDFHNAISVSSCCVVSLKRGLIGTCAPSKYYSYLKAGCPILSIGEHESYLSREIREKQIGYEVEVGEVDHLVNCICYMNERRDLLEQMSVNAKNLYLEKYEKDICLKKYAEAVESVIG